MSWPAAPPAAGSPRRANKELLHKSYSVEGALTATFHQRSPIDDDKEMEEALAMLGELAEHFDGGQLSAAGNRMRRKPSFDVNKASRLLREHAPLLADAILTSKAGTSLHHSAGPSACAGITSTTTSTDAAASSKAGAAAAGSSRNLKRHRGPQAAGSTGKPEEVTPKKAFELLQRHAPLVVEMLTRGPNSKHLKVKTCPKAKAAATEGPEFMQAFELLQRYIPYFKEEIRDELNQEIKKQRAR